MNLYLRTKLQTHLIDESNILYICLDESIKLNKYTYKIYIVHIQMYELKQNILYNVFISDY